MNTKGIVMPIAALAPEEIEDPEDVEIAEVVLVDVGVVVDD